MVDGKWNKAVARRNLGRAEGPQEHVQLSPMSTDQPPCHHLFKIGNHYDQNIHQVRTLMIYIFFLETVLQILPEMCPVTTLVPLNLIKLTRLTIVGRDRQVLMLKKIIRKTSLDNFS